jgi:pilus assembly protein Flp/PilA
MGSFRAGFVLFNHHMEFVMNKFTSAVQAFLADEEGVTAIEYGLIAALIGVALTVGASTLGTDLNSAFDKIAQKVSDSVSAL